MSKKSSRPGSKGVRSQSRSFRPSEARHYERRCTPGTPTRVKDYFRKIGLMRPFAEEEDYEECLLERFGNSAAEFLNTARATRQHGEAICALMSKSLDLALAVRSQFCGNRYETFLSWLATVNLWEPKTVLDVGCDIGVLTCFYALLFPEATITGIDHCPEAIACATRLVERLQLRNVEFQQADMLDLPDHLKGQTFDLVFSTFVASYSADPDASPRPARCVEEAVLQEPDPGKAQYARVLAELMTEDGVLVSFERNPFPVGLAQWLRVLCDAGICIPIENIEMLQFYDAALRSSLETPVVLGSKRAGSQPVAEDIRRLWMPGPRPRFDGDDYEDVMAESVFVASEPKSFVRGFRHRDRGCRLELYTELWVAGPHALIYDYAGGGHGLRRDLVEDSADSIELLRAEFSEDPDVCFWEEYASPEDAF